VQLPEKDVCRGDYSFLVSDLKQNASSFIVPISAHDYGHAKLAPLFNLLLFCHLGGIPAAVIVLCDDSTLYVKEDITIEMNAFCLKLQHSSRSKTQFCPHLLHSSVPIVGSFFSLVIATESFSAFNQDQFLASGTSSFHRFQEGAKARFSIFC